MSNHGLVADPLFSPFLSYGILISFTLVFILWEWRKKIPYVYFRIVSVIFMMAGLAGFLIRPLYKTSYSEKIILLTPDYKKSQVDSLLVHYPEMRVFQSRQAKRFGNSTILKSYHDLSGKQENIAFILGQGLPPEALDLFSSRKYKFIPARYPEGIIRLSLPDKILANRLNTIEGIFNNRGKNTKIYLEGPLGNEDSASLSENGLDHFKLSFFSKEPGNFLYIIKAGESIIEKLPITVAKTQPLNILFIQHYPTFETRYLTKFLGKYHRLSIKSQLSKNRYRVEYINRKFQSLLPLSKKSLSAFDLLIIDADALGLLNALELKNLQSSIKEGLGMLILHNVSRSGLQQILPFTFKRYPSDTARIKIKGFKQSILPALPYQVQSPAPLISTVRNKNRILSGYGHSGFGKVGFQLLQETFQLILQGDSVLYSLLWSPLLEQTSRTAKAAFTIRYKTKFPFFTDSPIPFEIRSTGEFPVISLNNMQLPLEENILIDDLWEGKFWADTPGWNHLLLGTDSIDLYISEKNKWQSLYTANNLEETRITNSPDLPNEVSEHIFLPMPPWIFYAIFLLGAAFLWLSPKL